MNFCIYSGFVAILLLSSSARATQASPAALASQYSLSTSTSLPYPTATLSSSNSQSLIISQWSLSKGRIQDQASDLAFVANPFPEDSSNSSNPVLQVTYPAGSYSHNTGGSQFENLWNTTDGSSFQSMLLSYEVAFDKNFDWVLGGKLPGLRGGTNATGCSGGDEPTGLDCFSTRLMWRPDGVGEVYAYIPTTSTFCQETDIICNSDFGVSISRGSFTFVSGEWNRITLFVQLNDPVTTANGNLQLYFNDQQVISRQDLQFRRGSSVDINGFYFSTFFGGSDDTWATPTTTHTYYRNIQLWGGANPANGTTVNSAVNPALRTIRPINSLLILVSILATACGILI
ncbi:polysaccharide lyase family 14 protein [Lentinula detonsa]|uniref:Polysaccharide lyase family 14 protein n=1 Tax=Lentinula detonsa TaxID=2804962 RepID=A0AA38Q7M9_9AGAR|nr:polysaccharide lyase family 14 protein [Lentinula detonsa]